MPVLDEPHSGEVSKRNLGRTTKSHPEVEMQEALSRTAHGDFSETMGQQLIFKISDMSVVSKNRTKKRAFDTKQTYEQFFSGSSVFPGSSARNDADQHVETSTVSLSSDRRLRAPSQLSTSSEPFSDVMSSLPTLRRPEVTDFHSNSNDNEPTGTYEISNEIPSINIPVSSTLMPEADALLNYSFGSSGNTRIPPQMNNHPTYSIAVAVDDSAFQTRLPESAPSSSNYAHYPFQENSALHEDRSSPARPRPTQTSARVLPFPYSQERNAENIVRSYHLGTSEYVDQADRSEPHGMSDGPSNKSDSSSETTLPFKIARVEVNGAVQFICVNQSTGEERGPVDVTDVLQHFLDQFTGFLAPTNINPSVDYQTGVDSTYFGIDDEGSIATSPATSISSPLSANPCENLELQSTTNYYFLT